LPAMPEEISDRGYGKEIGRRDSRSDSNDFDSCRQNDRCKQFKLLSE